MDIQKENNLIALNNEQRILYRQAKAYENIYSHSVDVDYMQSLYFAIALAEDFGDGSLLKDNVKRIEDIVNS